jgi:hypothetical protein
VALLRQPVDAFNGIANFLGSDALGKQHLEEVEEALCASDRLHA